MRGLFDVGKVNQWVANLKSTTNDELDAITTDNDTMFVVARNDTTVRIAAFAAVRMFRRLFGHVFLID